MELTPDDILFIDAICHYFQERGEWPTLRWLERELHDHEDIDVLDLETSLLQQMHGVYIPHRLFEPDRQVQLTISVLNIWQPALKDELNAFVNFVCYCVDKYNNDIVPLTVNESETIGTLGMSELMAHKVFLIAKSDGNLHGGSSDAPDWALTISTNVRVYRKVKTFDDYLAVLDEQKLKSVQHIGSLTLRKLDVPSPLLFPNLNSSPIGTQIFVVHGHDNATKYELARFIEKVGLEAIILDEQPNKGRTIIEKFEHYSESVGFAVILLTPDDISTSKDYPSIAHEQARPNVLFELGYFVGRLGRGKVCLLRKGHTDIPSDLHGVVYISLDDGQWKLQLGKELREAGLPADLNKL